jgi:methionine aminopeptidase
MAGWLANFSRVFVCFIMMYVSDVCTKYQQAASIVNLALEGLVSQCVPGAKILDLCEFGHTIMETQAAKLYTKKVSGKTIDRGVAFPVCVSVNDIVCNHSPLPSEERVSAFRTIIYIYPV